MFHIGIGHCKFDDGRNCMPSSTFFTSHVLHWIRRRRRRMWPISPSPFSTSSHTYMCHIVVPLTYELVPFTVFHFIHSSDQLNNQPTNHSFIQSFIELLLDIFEPSSHLYFLEAANCLTWTANDAEPMSVQSVNNLSRKMGHHHQWTIDVHWPRLLVTWNIMKTFLVFLLFMRYVSINHSASVPNVYNRSPFTTHRLRYEQTGPHVSREQFTNAFKEALGDVRTSLKSHADNFDGKSSSSWFSILTQEWNKHTHTHTHTCLMTNVLCSNAKSITQSIIA